MTWPEQATSAITLTNAGLIYWRIHVYASLALDAKEIQNFSHALLIKERFRKYMICLS